MTRSNHQPIPVHGYPCPYGPSPPHPHTYIYDVKVKRTGIRCDRGCCFMLHLTYTEMWEAWLNMRGDTVVPGLVKETHSKYVNVGAGSHARVRERYPYHTSAGQGSPHKRKEKDSGRQDRYDKKDMGRNDEQARGSDEIRKPKLRPYPWARQEHVEKPAPQPKPREEEDKGNKVEKKPKPKKKVRWGMVTEIPPSPVKW